MIFRARDGAESYDIFSCTFDFLPGAAGGIYPVNRQLMPSIFLPFLNLIEWHTTISPLAASSDKWRCTLVSEIPAAKAISVSSCSPCFLRYCRISFIGSLLKTLRGVAEMLRMISVVSTQDGLYRGVLEPNYSKNPLWLSWFTVIK